MILEEKRLEIMKKIKKSNDLSITKDRTEKIFLERKNLSDSRNISDYKIDKDGSVMLMSEGILEPMRLVPDNLTINLVSIYKRLVYLILDNLVKMGWLKRIITLITIQINYDVFTKWLEYIFATNQILLKEEHYSQPVKEIRRVLRYKFENNLFEAITLILECDSAYRYRFQDIIAELKKENLKNPRQELLRLWDIMTSRETILGQLRKYKSLRKFISLAIFVPKIKKLVVSILTEINIDEVKMTKADIYWSNEYGVYNFRGLNSEQRKQENKL